MHNFRTSYIMRIVFQGFGYCFQNLQFQQFLKENLFKNFAIILHYLIYTLRTIAFKIFKVKKM